MDTLPSTIQIDENDIDLEEKMDQAFKDQKSFLDSNPNIKTIVETWPILVTRKGALYFFSKITNSDLNMLANVVEEKFSKFCKLTDHPVNEENSKILEAFSILCKYFKEEPSGFYKQAEVSVFFSHK